MIRSKRIAFYSFNGTHTSLFLALLAQKPGWASVDWYIQKPIVEPFTSFIDTEDSVRSLGLPIDRISIDWRKIVKLTFLKGLFKNKFYCWPRAENEITFENARIFSLYSRWDRPILSSGYDGVIIPSIHVDPLAFNKVATRIPVFLHEYGNTFKWDEQSSYIIGADKFPLLKATFTLGKLHHHQCAHVAGNRILTGGAKTDLFFSPLILPSPSSVPFLLYLSTLSHLPHYGERIRRLSNPEGTIPWLKEIAAALKLKLVVKIHPNGLFLLMDYMKNEKEVLFYTAAPLADVCRQAAVIVSDPSSGLIEALLGKKPSFLVPSDCSSWNYLEFVSKYIPRLDRDKMRAISQIQDSLGKSSEGLIRLLDRFWFKPDGRRASFLWQKLGEALD